MGTDQELAILFADVVGSTQLYESLGDEAARDTVQQCVDIMREATDEHAGTVIKTMGDEVMSTFPDADQAINAACQMQQLTSGRGGGDSDDGIVAIRIGCHYGQVVVDDRDVFGATVHTANRMTSQAKAGQIITTQDMIDRLNEDWQSLVRQIGVAVLRGQTEEVALFEVLWQPEEATSMLPKIKWGEKGAEAVGRLVLKCQGHQVSMESAGKQTVTLGRGDSNDLPIKGNLISRLHARIELRKNRYMLVDESTNGTFIQQDDGEEIYIRRDSAQLKGSGVIGLGRVAVRETPLAVEFQLED
ncbi:MAG: adenylate/guanylate cyclase domain-containing protein [Gammaproteobacteria bacterium]